MLTRKQLIHSIFGASSLAITGAIGCPKPIDGEIRWNMATSWDRGFQYEGAKDICKYVNKMTNGKFYIALSDDNFGINRRTLESVSEGKTIQCAHTAGYYYEEENPALIFSTTIPFGLNTRQRWAWLYRGGGIQIINDIYKDFNIISFPAGNTGLQMGGWFKNKVNSINDLQKVRMRIPGLGADVMQRLGVQVFREPIGQEIIQELKKNDRNKNKGINAAEWISPHEDMILGLHKYAKFYYYPGWWDPSTSLELQINKEAFEALPKEYQSILESACTQANVSMLANFDQGNIQEFQKILESEPEIQILAFSRDIMKAAQDKTHEILEEKAENSDFKQVYKKWKDFKKEIDLWYSFNELSFDSFNLIGNLCGPSRSPSE